MYSGQKAAADAAPSANNVKRDPNAAPQSKTRQ